ncbi:MAG: 4Fe-4S binding protein [Kiritimatiellae bacterium]|nr:4Fe-4S binding protein [Kiritimatiellia bacterium]
MDKTTGRPVLRRDLCISCSCCHEICPNDAIRMNQSALLRLLEVFKGVD